MTTDDRRVKVNGVELHVRTAGSGHPLVLLHGWPQTSYCWRKIIPALAPKFSIIAPDLRGFGDSDKPASGYDKRTVARDIEELLSVLGHRRAVVGGHDIGARVAFRLALDHPELVERLVILSGRYPPLGTSRMFEPPQALERWYFFFHQLPKLPDILVTHVTKLTERHETRRATPWAVSDAPEDYIRGQLKRIIGFEIPIARLEGKWKMSQNRPAQDRVGVVEGLVREGGPAEAAVATIVTSVNKD